MSIKLLTAITACMAISCSTASAQPRDVIQACKADVQSLCATVERGEGRIAQCLKDNEDRVSSACKSQIQALSERMKSQRGGAGGRHQRANPAAPAGSAN